MKQVGLLDPTQNEGMVNCNDYILKLASFYFDPDLEPLNNHSPVMVASKCNRKSLVHFAFYFAGRRDINCI